ncbi:unnamed protein product [Effrenium voratum]|nr:unnamed protein product [Effrenium voratum]
MGPELIARSRLKQLLKDRDTVHQDELIDMLVNELEAPHTQSSLPRKEPIYSSHKSLSGADVMTLDQPLPDAAASAALEPRGLAGGPASLKLLRGDIEAFVVTQRHNRDHEVDVNQLIHNIYQPPDEKKVIHYVNDGLNRALRGNPPPRERPADSEKPRYENYWQARYVMEALADAIALVENSNGGKLKPSKMFKRLDFDNDGYLSMSDLRSACEKYKIANSSPDLHALFSLLDKDDRGAVDIGEFTRNYQVHQGSLLDSMMRPIKSVKHEGGVEFGGPVQDSERLIEVPGSRSEGLTAQLEEKLDAHMKELEALSGSLEEAPTQYAEILSCRQFDFAVKRICQRSGKLSSIGVWLQDFRLRHVYPPWRTMAMGITVQALLSLLRQARAIGAVPLHVVCRISVPTPSVVLSSRPAAGFYDEDGTKFAGPTPRDVEWTSPELLEPPVDSDSRLASLPVSAKGSSMDALRRLAESSPQKPPVLPEGVDGNEAFQDWVRKQVDLDTANLTLQSFELETKNHRLSRKMSAAKALSGLAPFEAMSDLYQTVYRIYLRKLERLCANLPARSKETTALKKLCDCLNVESDGSIASLLARLRATDIMRKPM